MYCSNCGKELDSDAKFCTECGKMIPTQKSSKESTTKETVKEENIQTTTVTNIPESNSKAVASLVLGIISIFIGVLIVPLPIVGLILGILQKKKGGLAIAGIILNSLALFIAVISWLIIIFAISSKDYDYDNGYYYNDTYDDYDDDFNYNYNYNYDF